MPDAVIDKPKIGFFNGAVAGWFSAQANGAIADWLLTERPCYSEFIDRGEVRAARSRAPFGPAGPDRAQLCLLSILMLEMWLADLRAAGSSPLPMRCLGVLIRWPCRTPIVTPVRNEEDEPAPARRGVA